MRKLYIKALSTLSVLLIVLTMLHTAPHRAQAQTVGHWVETAWFDPVKTWSWSCIDVLEPYTLIGSVDGKTVTYNWVKRQLQVIHDSPLTYCGNNGLLFSQHHDGTMWRFTTSDLAPRQVSRIPTHSAKDGTLQLYSLEAGVLWSSADGGLSWQQRPVSGSISSLAVMGSDARSIYITVDNPAAQRGIYFSSDAGQHWERRAAFGDKVWQVSAMLGNTAPMNSLARVYLHPYPTTHGSCHYELEVSSDGGQTGHAIGGIFHQCWPQDGYVYTSAGMLVNQGGCSIALSRNGGTSWEQRLQLRAQTPSLECKILVAPTAPANVFVLDNHTHALHYSANGGIDWREISGLQPDSIMITPYLPMTIIAFKGPMMYTLSLPDAGKPQINSAPFNGVAGGLFFPQTGHNLWGHFKTYWEQHGGLAQFGYPQTEPFLELNPTDGKVYMVQYFERNRFEYHPELAGTPYEVLLGLLGTQFTAGRQGEAPFQRVSGATQPDAIYFPETGHTLRGAFRPYWERNGGLAIYGYPISEEFVERNEDDGQMYIVQYFERARFEYHPENKGTQYEVLLGLLGNKLLRQKGWLPQ